MSQDVCDNEICALTQLLQIQKNQLIDLLETLERYSNVLPVSGFNFRNKRIFLLRLV